MEIRKIQEREFEGFKEQLFADAAKSKEPKGGLVIGILKDMVWTDQGFVVAALDGNTCLGLAVIAAGNGDTAEIEQWVTSCSKTGIGKAMRDWLIAKYRVVTLFPTGESKPAYKRMGFQDMEGGFMKYVAPSPAAPLVQPKVADGEKSLKA